jgi:hypothetical protein
MIAAAIIDTNTARFEIKFIVTAYTYPAKSIGRLNSGIVILIIINPSPINKIDKTHKYGITGLRMGLSNKNNACESRFVFLDRSNSSLASAVSTSMLISFKCFSYCVILA